MYVLPTRRGLVISRPVGETCEDEVISDPHTINLEMWNVNTWICMYWHYEFISHLTITSITVNVCTNEMVNVISTDVLKRRDAALHVKVREGTLSTCKPYKITPH